MFDGTVLSVPTTCGHVLVSEQRDNLFRISATFQNCTTIKCQLSLHIRVEDDEFIMENTNEKLILTNEENSLSLPGYHSGMLFETVGNWLFVEAQSLGFKLYWDRHNYLVVKLDGQMWGRTSGLCGSLSGNPYDDYQDVEGKSASGLSNFVESWTLDEHECNSLNGQLISVQHPCQILGTEANNDATKFCSNMLYNEGLNTCFQNLNPLPYYESCKWSYCKEYNNIKLAKEFGCQAAESYVRACKEQDNTPVTWRQNDFCCK